jgi:hypothetical protein
MGMTNSSFDPASRIRFIQFMPYFKQAGWQVEHRPTGLIVSGRASLPTSLRGRRTTAPGAHL